ncbi:MAG TPA: phosphatase PAP2 family protein [Rhodopila sp.]|nr:phosphatase PAP2 family protein [Rhodopila sp.]
MPVLLVPALPGSTGALAQTAPGSAPALAPVPEIRPGVLQGYLARDALPNSLALIPPPPAANSAAFARDQAFSKRGQAMRGSGRWTLATSDADLSFPHAAGTFTCALGVSITEQDAPHLYRLLRRGMTDAGYATAAAKDHYQRARPFMRNRQATCTPKKEADLRTNGSYPSGHASIGTAWALILSELAPDRADAIEARGRSFGQSRVVCNVHWESDVLAGQFIGAATVARLHADPVFRAELDAAKAELAAVRSRGKAPEAACAAEAAALALDPPQSP